MECLVKKERRKAGGEGGVSKRLQEWKQREGEDICCILTERASTARRLHRANRGSYTLFTPGPHCGRFPMAAPPPPPPHTGSPGSWLRVPEGGLKAGNGPRWQTHRLMYCESFEAAWRNQGKTCQCMKEDCCSGLCLRCHSKMWTCDIQIIRNF